MANSSFPTRAPSDLIVTSDAVASDTMGLSLRSSVEILLTCSLICFVLGAIMGRRTAYDEKVKLLLTLLDRNGNGHIDQADIDYVVGHLIQVQELEENEFSQKLDQAAEKASCWKNVTITIFGLWIVASCAFLVKLSPGTLAYSLISVCFLILLVVFVHWMKFVREEEHNRCMAEERHKYIEKADQFRANDKNDVKKDVNALE